MTKSEFSVLPSEVTKDVFANFTYAVNEFANRGNVKLFPFQKKAGFRAIYSLLEKKGWELLWVFSRQSGKTEVVAAVAIFLAAAPAFIRKSWISDTPSINIACFGPKEKQADLVFSRLKEKATSGFMEEMLGLDVYVIADRIEISGISAGGRPFKSTILRSTASKTSSIEGLTLHMAIIDEAQDVVEERIVKSIYPMLATTMGTRVLLGTLTTEHTYYFNDRIGAMKRHDDKVIRRNLMIYDWTHRAKHDPVYKSFVESEILERGIDDPLIQSQYFLRLDAAHTSNFITSPDAFRMMGVGGRMFACQEPCSVGIDPAKINDSSVVTVKRRSDNRPLNWLEMQGVNYKQQERMIREFLRPYNVAAIVVEQNSPGIVMADYLNSPPSDPMLPDFTGRVYTFWSSLGGKSELYTAIMKQLSDGGWTYPADGSTEARKFQQQFVELEKSYMNGKMKVDHPKRRDAHNDFPDSFALTYHADTFGINYYGTAIVADEMARRGGYRPKRFFKDTGGNGIGST